MNISKKMLQGVFDPDALRYSYTSAKTGQQKVAETGQSIAARRSGDALGQENKLTDSAQGTFSQFEGPVQDSPFYKALLTSGTEATSRAYDTARSNMRAKANAAGFGYAQPVAQGAENQLGAQEASSLAAVPREALTATAPLALQAGQDTAGLAESKGREALGWDSSSANWNNDAYNMQKNRKGWLENFNAARDTFGPGITQALSVI